MTEYGQPYGYPPAGYVPPPAGYGLPTTTNAPTAITVLVLGIVSLVSLALCPVVGLVPAIVALSMAGRANREIQESMGRYSGLGMVTAGRITSWITIGIHALALVAFVFLFVVLGVFSAA